MEDYFNLFDLIGLIFQIINIIFDQILILNYNKSLVDWNIFIMIIAVFCQIIGLIQYFKLGDKYSQLIILIIEVIKSLK